MPHQPLELFTKHFTDATMSFLHAAYIYAEFNIDGSSMSLREAVYFLLSDGMFSQGLELGIEKLSEEQK